MNPRIETDFSYTYIRPPGRVSTYHTKLLHADESVIVMLHPSVQPSSPSVHFGEEVLGTNYNLLWFLFNGEPYDVARFYRPDGTFTGYYVDVLEPVAWQGSDPATLSPIVDLFLDVWIAPDGRRLVLDEDELREAAEAGAVTQSQVEHAHTVLRRILRASEAGDFPPKIVTTFPWPDSASQSGPEVPKLK